MLTKYSSKFSQLNPRIAIPNAESHRSTSHLSFSTPRKMDSSDLNNCTKIEREKQITLPLLFPRFPDNGTKIPLELRNKSNSAATDIVTSP